MQTQKKVSFKNKIVGAVLMSALVILPTLSGTSAKADTTRDFMLSAAYGALAGTLVGAASLAFSERPGENLNKVARGASLGLYAGILLGLYVSYGSGTASEDDIASIPKSLIDPDLLVVPLLTERGLEGAQASYTFLRF